jgi:hypothetical protein
MEELNHLRAHVIDALLAGVLDEPAAHAAEAHARSCTACGERLATARADRDAFLAHNPPALRAERLVAARPRRWRWALAPLMPALVALLLWIRPPTPQLSVHDDDAARVTFAGDALVIEPARHHHVALYAAGDDVWRLLVDLEIERQMAVPYSRLRGDERIVSVFSEQAVEEAAVRAAARLARDGRGVIDGAPLAEMRTLDLSSHRDRTKRP